MSAPTPATVEVTIGPMAVSRPRGTASTFRERRSRPDDRTTASPEPANGTVLRPDRRAPEAMLDLQRHAGNAAVTGLLQRAPLDPKDDPQGHSSPTVPVVPTVSRAWTTKDAAGEYALTQDERTLLGSQTGTERAGDVTALKAGRSRLRALERKKKQKEKRKESLTADEEKELTDLRALQERTESAQRALKRLDVEDILTAANFTVSGWYGDVQTGTFLGISLHVHKSLADKLTRAETALVGDKAVNPTKLGAAALGAALNMYASTSDIRAPKKAVGGSSLSLHTFGLAVDLNYRGNPFLGNAGNDGARRGEAGHEPRERHRGGRADGPRRHPGLVHRPQGGLRRR